MPKGIKSEASSDTKKRGRFAARLMLHVVNACGEVCQASAATVGVQLCVKTELNSGTENLCWISSGLTPRIVNAHWDENRVGAAAVRTMRRGADTYWVPLGSKSKLVSGTKM